MKVTLADVLEARDRRQEKRLALAREFGLPVVVFTVNMPGEEKSNEISDYIFEAGVEAISRRLLDKIVSLSVVDAPTGNEAFFVTDASDASELKRETCSVEEEHFLGRLFDIDVYDGEGRQICRSELGLSERKCLLCERDARQCARSRAHPLDELLEKIARMKEEYELLYD
ncbi:MAG: citrate lyase holo-[acyl-carrier protein] synthase [Clostridia bacterium]|nr:citrate lyase holo-[acyl-carrier protein] synthase [Clostridia bacterium]